MKPPEDQHTTSAPDQRRPPGWRARTVAELLSDQLAALDTWHRAHVGTPDPAADDAAPLSREDRLDAARLRDARAREHAALLARAAEQLWDSAAALGSERPRTLLAHRSDWFRTKVAERLEELGVDVVCSVADGASAVAAMVLDQPDLMLVEDRMAHLSGPQVLARARQFAPLTLVAAQVSSTEDMDALAAAGARAVFSRRIPPAEVAEALVACLAGQQEVVRLV